VTKIQMALDADNNFTALRTDTYANMARICPHFAPLVPPRWLHGPVMAGNYKTPLIL